MVPKEQKSRSDPTAGQTPLLDAGHIGVGISTAPAEESKLRALSCNRYVFPGNQVLQEEGETLAK